MTRPYHIVKFGIYRRASGAEKAAAQPAEKPDRARPNAYLALIAYMRRQKESIKR